MDNKTLLDLYSDYLISAFGQTTGTGLAELLGGTISHDRIQRFLSQNEFTSGDLWQLVKPHVRAIQASDGVLIVDDSIAEKPYTDENEIVCWHYDHAQDRQVKGIKGLSEMRFSRFELSWTFLTPSKSLPPAGETCSSRDATPTPLTGRAGEG